MTPCYQYVFRNHTICVAAQNCPYFISPVGQGSSAAGLFSCRALQLQGSSAAGLFSCRSLSVQYVRTALHTPQLVVRCFDKGSPTVMLRFFQQGRWSVPETLTVGQVRSSNSWGYDHVSPHNNIKMSTLYIFLNRF